MHVHYSCNQATREQIDFGIMKTTLAGEQQVDYGGKDKGKVATLKVVISAMLKPLFISSP